MEPGLHTHTRYVEPPETLAEVRAMNYVWGRADLQENTVEEAVGIIGDLRTADLVPLVIMASGDQVRAVREQVDPPLHVSYRNEPDGQAKIPAAVYHRGLEEFAIACREVGFQGLGGVVENTHNHGMGYIKACWPFPDGIWVDIHRYAPTCHAREVQQGSHTRAGEIARLKSIIGHRPWLVSEFGYSVDGRLTEDQQAEEIRQEWGFWRTTDCIAAILYQLRCGPGTSRLDNYGIHRFDGTWRPAAHLLETS